MTRVESASFHPKAVVSAIARFRAPLGQYDPSQILNLGSNRWSFSPQVAISHISRRLLLEGHVGTWFFTDNTEFAETSTLAQDPLFSFQVHVGYLTRRVLWVAISSRQNFGGATQVDGGEKTEREANSRLGATISVPVGRRYALKAFVTASLTTTVGNDYDTFGAAFAVVL